MMKSVLKLFLAVYSLMLFFASPVFASEVKDVRYSIDGGNSWQEDSLLNAIWSGYGYDVIIELQKDIILTNDNWSVGAVIGYKDKKWTIDGKGFKITRNGNFGKMFSVNQPGSEVTLKDVTIDGGAIWEGNDISTRTNIGLSFGGNARLFDVYGGSTLILESGTVLQNSDLKQQSYGAAISVGDTGAATLIMKEGASVLNNAAESGAGIYIASGSTFKMEGGKISGNYASSGGGGIFTDGITTMTNGEISFNASGNNGGGIGVNGAFSMSNGSIKNNKSKAGGGGITALNGNVSLAGGSVIQNTITGSMGGGILVHNGTLDVSSSIVVTDNTINGDIKSNVYLSPGKIINISDELISGANIGVTLKNDTGIFTALWNDNMNNNLNDYYKYFTSDKGYTILLSSENELQMDAITVTFDANDGSDNIKTMKMGKGVETKLIANSFTRANYVFTGWNTKEDGTGEKYNDEDDVKFNEGITLYAQWEEATYNLTIENVIFDTIKYGESVTPTPQAIKIKNSGNSTVTISSITLSDDSFILNNGNTTVKAGETNTSYTISPKENLKAGEYTTNITISYNNAKTVTSTVTFKINKGVMTDIEVIGYSGVYDENEHGITKKIPEGATISYGTIEGDYSLNESPTYIDAGEYKVYYKIEKENFETITNFVTIEILPKEQTKPTPLVPIASNKNYGTISHINLAMEYSTSENGIYVPITDVNMRFAPGTYYIRYAATKNYKESEATMVIITAKTDNPDTSDTINYYFIIGLISFVGLIVLTKIKKVLI